jgi:hypothetical protein
MNNPAIKLKWPCVLFYFGPEASKVMHHFDSTFFPLALPPKPDSYYQPLLVKEFLEAPEAFNEYTAVQVAGVVSGIHLDIIVDSGSCYSIMDEEFYKKLRKKPALLPWEFGSVSGIENGQLFPIGYCNIEVKIGNRTSHHPIAIMKDFISTVLLGVDFMYCSRLCMNFDKLAISFPKLSGSVGFYPC